MRVFVFACINVPLSTIPNLFYLSIGAALLTLPIHTWLMGAKGNSPDRQRSQTQATFYRTQSLIHRVCDRVKSYFRHNVLYKTTGLEKSKYWIVSYSMVFFSGLRTCITFLFRLLLLVAWNISCLLDYFKDQTKLNLVSVGLQYRTS